MTASSFEHPNRYLSAACTICLFVSRPDATTALQKLLFADSRQHHIGSGMIRFTRSRPSTILTSSPNLRPISHNEVLGIFI